MCACADVTELSSQRVPNGSLDDRSSNERIKKEVRGKAKEGSGARSMYVHVCVCVCVCVCTPLTHTSAPKRKA